MADQLFDDWRQALLFGVIKIFDRNDRGFGTLTWAKGIWQGLPGDAGRRLHLNKVTVLIEPVPLRPQCFIDSHTIYFDRKAISVWNIFQPFT